MVVAAGENGTSGKVIIPRGRLVHTDTSVGIVLVRGLATTYRLNAYHYGIAPADVVASPSREEFERLANEWKQDTGGRSALSAVVTHPAYLRIIGWGRAAVPLILDDLEQNGPAHWFPALRAITGDSPVPPQARGHMREMAAAWLRWGRLRHYFDRPRTAGLLFWLSHQHT